MRSKRERRKLWWAILGSLFVHLVVAYSLAAFGGGGAQPFEAEDRPVELTFVDLSPTPPPLVSASRAFMETDPAKESVEPPKEETFESNANSIAKSNLPASGDAPLPTHDEKDRPFVNLETQRLALPTEGDRPQPEPEEIAQPASTPVPVTMATPQPSPSAAPTATPRPEPIATPEPTQFALLTATPPPPLMALDDAEAAPEATAAVTPFEPRPRPVPPESIFQAQKQETRITGRITDRGISAVDAIGTPFGRYQKKVQDAIGSRWYSYVKSKADLVSIGTTVIEAEVDQEGHLQNLKVLSNTANEAFANICLQSFQEAQIPPIPPDMVGALPGGRMPLEISFTYFAN